jgi:hypothetical protein
MNFGTFSLYQWFCGFLIACLKPFTVVAETLLHVDVGERYAGMSALAALLLLGLDAEVCPATESTLVWLVIAAFAIRIVVLRMSGIRRRRRGDHSIHSRSAGTSVLSRWFSRLSPQAVLWIEPFVVLLVALIVSLLNSTVADFLLWSGGAMLAISLVRLSAAYSKALDDADAKVEQEARQIGSLIATSPTVSSVAPMIDVRGIQGRLFPVAAGGDGEGEPELASLLPLGGGEPWKH